MRQRIRGFSLLEAMIVTAMIAIALGFVGYLATRAYANRVAMAFVSDFFQLDQAIRTQYGPARSYAGLSTANAISDGLMPADLQASATTAQTTWGAYLRLGVSTLNPLGSATDPDQGLGSGFSISFIFADTQTCSSVLPQLLPRVAWLAANGTWVESPTQRIAPSAMASTVAGLCAAGGAAVSGQVTVIDG